jgi:hypothetical protein
MSLAGSHLGINATNIALGFWDLVVPIQSITDSEDLRKHFYPAENGHELDFVDVAFPFNALPAKILGLYSASLVTLQQEGIVWYSSENKHYVSANFPFNIALHITTVQVLRTQQFKKIALEGEKLYLQSASFILCVPTFKMDEDLFKTTFSIPAVGGYSPVAPIQMSTLLRSSDLFSGQVRFKLFNDGVKSYLTAIAEDRSLFTVPLLLGDATTPFDYTVTADSLFDIQSIGGVGQDFIAATSGVCIFFKS